MMKIIMYNNSLHSHFTPNLLVIEKTENIFGSVRCFTVKIFIHMIYLYTIHFNDIMSVFGVL